jgi:hypothetical protein
MRLASQLRKLVMAEKKSAKPRHREVRPLAARRLLP